jgi:hydrogenase expression/formation protein HypC
MCLAIPGKIVSLVDDAAHSAVIDVVGVRRRVDISLVEPEGIGPGDWVLIHVGFAMSKIREQDAFDQLRMLTALGETEAAMEEVRGYSADAADVQPAAGVQAAAVPSKERSFP